MDTLKGHNIIFKICSSRTDNPGVMNHNFEVMTVTPGLWTSHNHSSNPLPAVEAVVPYGITLKVMPHNPRVMECYFPNFLITAHNPRVTGNFPELSITFVDNFPRSPNQCILWKVTGNFEGYSTWNHSFHFLGNSYVL